MFVDNICGGNYKGLKLNLYLIQAEFDVAAKIGRVSGSVATCAEAYSSCPYTARQISSLYGSL